MSAGAGAVSFATPDAGDGPPAAASAVGDRAGNVAPATPTAAVAWTARVRAHVSPAAALRLLGGAALALALADFLLTGVSVQNDLQRFALLLAQTGLFAGGAFALERAFGDGRGARLLLGVALLSVPAGFAVLGAMLYAAMPLDGGAWLAAEGWLRDAGGADGGYPRFARWEAGGPRDLLVGLGAAALVLVPTTLFAFAVMVRRSARWLAPAFLGGCATLLLPLRDPALVAPIVGVSALALGWLLVRRYGSDPALETLEGRFARAALFVPPAIVTARALLMYPPDALLGLVFVALVHALFRGTVIVAGPMTRLQRLLYPLAALSALAVSLDAVLVFADTLGLWALPLGMLLGTALVLELRRHVAERRLYHVLEGVLAGGALVPLGLAALLAPHDILPPMLGASVVLVYALYARRAVIGALAGSCMALQLLPYADDAFELLIAHGWQSLIVGGALAVVGASWLERRARAPVADRHGDRG